MKRLITTILNLLLVCSLFLTMALPLAAQTDATYIHFAGHGKYVLNVDGSGTLSAVKQTDNAATPTDGMAWTLTGDDTNGYTVNSGTYYIKYNEGAFETTTVEGEATLFEKNTYSTNGSFHKEGGEQYSLVIKDDAILANITDGKTALGMKDGNIVRAIPNSRYGNLRFPSTITGPDFPKTTDEDANALYNIRFTSCDYYAYADAVDGNILATNVGAEKYFSKCKWQFVKANEEGSVYIYTPKANGYMKTCSSGQNPFTLVADQTSATQFRLVVCYDEDSRNSVFVIYDNTSRPWKFMNYYLNHGDNGKNFVSNHQSDDPESKIEITENNETSGDFVTDTYIHFAGQGKNALFDNGDNTAICKNQENATEAPEGGFKWSISVSENGAFLKSGLGNYLKYDETNGFAMTANEADACYFNIETNTYFPAGNSPYLAMSGDRISLTLKEDATKALGLKQGTLTTVPTNSRYSCIRPAQNVDGLDYPKSKKEEPEANYDIQFSQKNNSYIHSQGIGQKLDHPTNGNNFESKWRFVEDENTGHVYIENYFGGYIKAGVGVHDSYTLVSDIADATPFILGVYIKNNATKVFSLYDTQNTGKGDKSYINFRDTDVLIGSWNLDDGGALSITKNTNSEFPYIENTYIHFAGQGKNALFDKNDGTVSAQNQTNAAEAPAGGYSWDIVLTDKGACLKSSYGKYLKYDGTAFSMVDDIANAAAFNIETNTFHPLDNTQQPRYSLVFKNYNLGDGTSAALGMKNGQLILAKVNSRYDCIRLAQEVNGPDFPKTLQEDANAYYNISFPNVSNAHIRTAKLGEEIYKTLDPNETTKNQLEYKWQFEETDDNSGEVYIKNYLGEYMKSVNARNRYYTVNNKNEATKFRLVIFNDSPDYNSTFAIYENTGRAFDRSFLCAQSNENTITYWSYNWDSGKLAITENNNTNTNYIHFAGQGKNALFDKNDGTVTAQNQENAAEAPAGGYSWNIVPFNNSTYLKSSYGKYLKYDGTAFSMVDDIANASAFNIEANTFHPHLPGNRYSLVFKDQTLDDEDRSPAALGMRNGKLVLAKVNSRYDCIRMAQFVNGPEFPQTMQEAPDAYYNIIFTYENRYAKSTSVGTNTGVDASPTSPNQTDYKWQFEEANDESGEVYLRSYFGGYINAAGDKAVMVGSKAEATKFRIMVANDNTSDDKYYETFSLYNNKSGSYSFMHYSNGNIISWGYNSGASKIRIEKNSTIDADYEFLDNPRYIQFTGQGKNALFLDTDTDGHTTLAGKVQEDATAAPTAGFAWTITQNGTGFVVKNRTDTTDTYLKFVDSTNEKDWSFTTTTNEGEAALFDIRTNNFHPNNKTRYSLTVKGKMLANGNSAALGLKHGKITVVDYNSRYDCLLIRDHVDGPDFPKTTNEDGKAYYNISFPHKNNRYIYAGNPGDILYTSVNPDASNQKEPRYLWKFEEADDYSGEVYIKNYWGGYMKAATSNGGNYTLTDADDKESATKFKLVEVADHDNNDYKTSLAVYEITNNSYHFINFSGSTGNVSNWNNAEDNNSRLVFINEPDYLPDYLEEPHYLQFAGQGRNALFQLTDGRIFGRVPADGSVEPAQNTNYAWSLYQTENGYKVKNASGKYLQYNPTNQSFTAVNEAEATTTFSLRKNTFYPTGETRYSLVINGVTDEKGEPLALGLKHSEIQAVPVNSRYDCLRIFTNVVGPDFPLTKIEDDSKWYNIKFPRLNNFIYAGQIGEKLFAASSNMEYATQNKWRFVEANDEGEVYIESFTGGYIKAADNNDNPYTLTGDINEATLFRIGTMNDNSDSRYNSNFFIYHKPGANVNSFIYLHETYRIIKNYTYPSENSYVTFIENSRTNTFSHKYIQLSGSGNMVLFDNAEGKLEVHQIMAATVNQRGYFWADELVEGEDGKVTNQFRLRSEEGNYIRYDQADGTFKMTDKVDEATKFDRTLNTYMLNNEVRYNIKVSDLTGTSRAMGLIQDDDNNDEWKLTLVETNSRMACIRIADRIPSRGFPKMSHGTVFQDDEKSYWYSMRFLLDNNYLLKTGDEVVFQQNPTDITGPLFKWRFLRAYAENDPIYRGDVYIQNQTGYFIALKDGKLTLTKQPQGENGSIPSDAHRLRITCYNDDTNETTNSGWHVREIADNFINSTNNVYMYKNGNNPGLTNGPRDVTSVEIKAIDTEYYRFVVFPAAGSPTLCDGLNKEDAQNAKPHAHHMGSGDINTDHLRWNLKMVNTQGQVILKNRFRYEGSTDDNFGYYLTWNKNDGFGISTNEADAYKFNRQRTNYENNRRLRYELMKNDGSDQALRIGNLETGELEWGEPGTRFSVMYTFEMVAGPALPKSSVGGSDFQFYRLRLQEGKHHCLTDIHPETPAEPVVMQAQDDNSINQLWAFLPYYRDGKFKGDYYLVNVYGKYLALNAAQTQFITAEAESEAAIIRPIETNSHFFSWQLEVVNRDGSRLKDNNILGAVNYNNEDLNGVNFHVPNENNNFLRLIPAEIYPEFYEVEGGTWRFIRFCEENGKPFMKADPDGNIIAKAEAEVANEELAQWKNIGNENDFILRNGNGQYLGQDADGNLILVTDSADAKHFYLWMNKTMDDEFHWAICELPEDKVVPEIPGKIMQVTSENKVVMTVYDETTAGLPGDKSTAQSWTENAMPNISNGDNETYYFIRLRPNNNDYLSDGPEDNGGNIKHDACAQTWSRRNGLIWKLDGQKSALKLVSRNGEYLVWNPDNQTFDVSTDSTEAAIFKLHTTAQLGESHTDLTHCYFQVVGGKNTESVINQYLYRKSDNHIALTSDSTDTHVQIVKLKYYDAADYTQFRIVPKRSWFLYQTMESPYEPITGFLPKHDSDYGWTENEYTGQKMQNTNTFRITHYVKQGTARTLDLPTHQADGGTTNLYTYQRWYDYKKDSLLPDNRLRLIDVTDWNNIINSRRDYANGTIMGRLLPLNYLHGGYVLRNVRFEMPEITDPDYQFVVGADCSMYTDFVDYFGDNAPVYSGAILDEIALPDHQNFTEPTLNQRCIFDIRDARQMADSLTACTKASGKWLEKRTITFPRKKMGYRHPTIPLNLQLQNYWFYKGGMDNADVNNDGIHDVDNLQNITGYDYITFKATSYKDGNVMSKNPITLDTNPIEAGTPLDTRRFIRFKYPHAKYDEATNKFVVIPTPPEGTLEGRGIGYFEGDSCIIEVYARDNATAGENNQYRLARFTLLFEDDIEPRPIDEIMGKEGEAYKTFRTPDKMRDDFGGAKASINFDDPDFICYQAPPFGKYNAKTGSDRKNTGTYGYPLLFENSAYNYQPGTDAGAVTWGGYTIGKSFGYVGVNAKPVYTYYKSKYNYTNIDDSYAALLYVDASEMPGEICSLDYEGNLCKGSRLYFSGWISSIDDINATTPANVILTVYGVTKTGEREELYSYCPGPIMAEARSEKGEKVNLENKYVPWQQMYFSFVNNSSTEFVKYTLTIDNVCTNSSGGDILIDDINIYSQAPTFHIEKTTPVCDQKITLAKLTSDFDGLITTLAINEKLGDEEESPENMPRLWYCLLDKERYYEKLTEVSHGNNIENATTENHRTAFNYSIVGKTNTSNRAEKAFRYAILNTNYNKIPDFSFAAALEDVIDERDKNTTGYIRKEINGNMRNIVISDRLNSEYLKPGRDYIIAFVPLDASVSINQSNAFDEFQWADACRIMSEFTSENAIRFVSNGEAGDDDRSLTACAGQTIGITPQMKGISLSTKEEEGNGGEQAAPAIRPLAGKDAKAATDNDGEIIYKIEHYDWWMDFMGIPMAQAFITKDGNFVKRADQIAQAGEVNVYQALVNFRHFFPKANSPKDADVVPSQTDGYVLTEAMIKGLAKLEYQGSSITASKPAEGEEHIKDFRPIVFNNSTLNLRLPDEMTGADGLVTITTIPILISDDNIEFCYDPQQVNVKVDGKAPSMTDGFDLKEEDSKGKYPDGMVNIPIRTSLGFLKNVTATEGENVQYTGKSMRIPLRIIYSPNNNATGLIPLQRDGDDYTYVYISGTNDPDMKVFEGTEEVVFRKIGVVKNMMAPIKKRDGQTYADIYFLKDFKPREGFTYTLRMEYKEAFNAGEKGDIITCDGSMSVDMHIVPKYVVWTGNADNDDWNNDNNWKRADLADLNLTEEEAQKEGYLSNEENGTMHAFAPLDHTSVIITDVENSPLLYDNGTTTLTEVDGKDGINHIIPELLETATPDMQWDLTTYEDSIDVSTKCHAFYNYNIKDMVLKAGAELLRSDYLHKENYDSVWVEYALNPDRWYTLGTPLKDVYAGDWYTDTKNYSADPDVNLNGHDLSPYFQPQTFNLDRHNRFAPAIYQKSWDKGEATVYHIPYNENGITGPEDSENVAIAANWSNVYNDVDVRYGYGEDIHDGLTDNHGGNSGGFSVKANSQGLLHGTTPMSYSDFLIRIPKEDTSFKIYTQKGDYALPEGKKVTRTNSHKLFSDDLEGKGTKEDPKSFVKTINNKTKANTFFLVGNPFTCGLDMSEFMKENADKIDSKYWLLTKEGQRASIKDETTSGSWITINDDSDKSTDGVLAPGQGFFVKAKTQEGVAPTGELVLTFNTNMMTSAHAVNATLRKPGIRNGHSRKTLRIRAERAGHTSEAVILKETEAANAFDANEDLEVILHNTLATTPMVYTIAGHQATSVNRRKSMYRIPLGIYSNSEAPTELTFSGMEEFDETLSLLDNLTGEVIPLTLSGKKETKVEVSGNTAGRYFILSSEKPSPEDELTDIKPIVEVEGNKVSISANASHVLTYIHIVDADGRTIYTMNPYQAAITLKLPQGIYIVDARTENQASTVKIMVN